MDQCCTVIVQVWLCKSGPDPEGLRTGRHTHVLWIGTIVSLKKSMQARMHEVGEAIAFPVYCFGLKIGIFIKFYINK